MTADGSSAVVVALRDRAMRLPLPARPILLPWLSQFQSLGAGLVANSWQRETWHCKWRAKTPLVRGWRGGCRGQKMAVLTPKEAD